MNKAGLFIIRFIAAYLGLSGLYQFLVYLASPNPDFFTLWVAKITSLLVPGTELLTVRGFNKIQVLFEGKAQVNIMEGCNGMAVWITLFAFVIAFKGKNQLYAWFLPLSLILLQLGNIFRLILLLKIKIHKPEWFEFFHTYGFPAALYAVAFGLMVWWTKMVKEK